MTFNHTFPEDILQDCLSGIPPIELKGMALLRERRSRLPGQFFPSLTGDAGKKS